MSSSSDPVAALGDAWRRAREALGFSSVRGREVTSTHLLRIDNYSTVMLSLMENRFIGRAADATATYDVSILDGGDGSLVHRHTDPGTPRLYSLRGRNSGGFRGIWVDIVEGARAEEQKKALRLLKEDSLVVRCDVTVKSLEQESRAKWFLRRFLQ